MDGDYAYLILSFANSALGFLLAYTQISYYKNKRCVEKWCWIKLALGIVGLYWGVLYVFIVLQTLGILPHADPVWFGRIFVRPALTITLAVVASGGLMRWKNGQT